MVFSQTSHKTQSVLKVVEIDRLKANKNQQVNGSTGVIVGGNTGASPPSPMATTSFSEDYLKTEPLFESTMFHDSDCEFFQDLVQWCSTPAKEEQALTIDSPKKTEDRAHTIDTTYTPSSPQGWDVLDANSPYAQAGFYNNANTDPLSPTFGGFAPYDSKFLNLTTKEPKLQYQEQFLDLGSLPVVIGDLTSESAAVANHWPVTEPAQPWAQAHNTDYTYANTHDAMPFIHQEDSLDSKLVSVVPRDVENNKVVISEYIISNDRGKEGLLQETEVSRRTGLSVDVAARPLFWPAQSISTPEVLSYVEQLEKEKCPQSVMKPASQWPTQEVLSDLLTPSLKTDNPSPAVDYEPVTPKSESHAESDFDDAKSHAKKKRHHDSDDSDETYTPYTEQSSRKYKRRKPNVPIKDMILALEGSQQLTKARRGRPPKRRESTVSSVCSVDDSTSSISTHETKYRELRDKNNEASKRSRMNRKLKELQMEQLVGELEERNKKLKVKADILEEMAKKLKDALMSAILQK